MLWLRNLRALPGRVARIHSWMEKFMTDTSPLLNQLAENLREFAAGPFAAMLAENATLRARVVELTREDDNETTAADNAVAAFNELVAPVTSAPEVPVEIPPVEVPAPSGEDEPAPGDGTAVDPAADAPAVDPEADEQ